MGDLINFLTLDRCPRCGIAQPRIDHLSSWSTQTKNHSGGNVNRWWKGYSCSSCGGVIVACSLKQNGPIHVMMPEAKSVDSCFPVRASKYLTQALASLHAPDGAVILANSAIDAMLKDKNYKEGSLYNRIDQAAKDHLITADMAKWAHNVRLDSNDQRHADDDASHATSADAERCIEFASALGEILYVLPARVERGIEDAKPGATA